MRQIRCALSLCALACLISQPCMVWAAKPSRSPAWRPPEFVRTMPTHHPKTLRYDLASDAIVRMHSVVAPEPKVRPGGDVAYTGNRLRTFRYLGPAGQGGIYEAFDEYQRSLDLDVRNYQYRR